MRRTIVLIGVSAIIVAGAITVLTVKTPTKRTLTVTVRAEGRLAGDVETEVFARVTARFETRVRDEGARDDSDSDERDEVPRVEGVVCQPAEQVGLLQCDVTYVASLPLCVRLPASCGPFGPGEPPSDQLVLAPRPLPPPPIVVNAPSSWVGPPPGGGTPGPALGGASGIGPAPSPLPEPIWQPPPPPMPMPIPAPVITPMPPMPMLFMMRVR